MSSTQRASRSKSRERKHALAAGPPTSDQGAEPDTRGRAGAPLETSTHMATSDSSVHSDGSADTELPNSEPHAYTQQSNQELVSLMKQLLTQQVTTNNLLAALTLHKNSPAPVGPVADSPALSETSDDASSLSYKTAPRPPPRFQSDTDSQPEGIPSPTNQRSTDARVASLERVIQGLRQQVDGQTHTQQRGNHDGTSPIAAQPQTVLGNAPPPFKPYFDDESVGIEGLWRHLTALRTYHNRYPSQRQYVKLANTISHEIIANCLRLTEDEGFQDIHDQDLKKALQAYLGWKVADPYEYVRIIGELKFEYKDEPRGIATTSDNIDCAQKYLTAVLRFTRFLTDTVHAAEIPDAVPNERKYHHAAANTIKHLINKRLHPYFPWWEKSVWPGVRNSQAYTWPELHTEIMTKLDSIKKTMQDNHSLHMAYDQQDKARDYHSTYARAEREKRRVQPMAPEEFTALQRRKHNTLPPPHNALPPPPPPPPPRPTPSKEFFSAKQAAAVHAINQEAPHDLEDMADDEALLAYQEAAERGQETVLCKDDDEEASQAADPPEPADLTAHVTPTDAYQPPIAGAGPSRPSNAKATLMPCHRMIATNKCDYQGCTFSHDAALMRKRHEQLMAEIPAQGPGKVVSI